MHKVNKNDRQLLALFTKKFNLKVFELKKLRYFTAITRSICHVKHLKKKPKNCVKAIKQLFLRRVF